MEEQTFSKLKLTFEHNVTQNDVEVIQELSKSLEDLQGLKLSNHLANSLGRLGKSLQSFKGVSVGVNLGKGISGLVEAINGISEVKDISPYAQRLNSSFKVLREATSHFEKNKASVGINLGKGITGLIDAANSLTEIKDIKPHADNLKESFKILSQATKYFDGNNAKIGINLGKGISGIVEAVNSIDEVKDISLQADNLRTGFHVLGYVSREFNEFSGKIPVNLGRGITGIIGAINSITEVKDIAPYAGVLKNNFKEVAEMATHFNGLNNADYSGISRLVTAMANIGKVEFVGDNVVKNAEQLAKAIQVLGDNVSVDTPKMEAMAKVAKELGFSFESASAGTDRFGRSLNLLNFELVIRNVRRLSGVLRGLARGLYDMVDVYGDVENTMSFFSQSLGNQAEGTARTIQQFADAGVINFTKFADQTAKLNQIYRGYGIAAEDAAKMALNMTQLAYDASFALGENGKDIELWMQRATSVAVGQTRSGYYFGVDTSVQSLMENFDGMSNSVDKATKSVAAHNTVIENTTAIQGQLAREQMNTYVQMDVFKNRIELLKQSIGKNLLPAFQGIIRYGLIAINVIVKLINALSLLFGGSGFELIRYEDMIKNVDTGVGNVADNAGKVADNMSKATKRAKELKKTITGIDQVFTINDLKNEAPAGGIGGSSGGVGGVGDLAGYSWDDLFNESLDAMLGIEESAERVFQWIKKIAPYALAVAGALAAWKISKSFMDSLKWISSLEGIGGGLGTIVIGVTLALIGYEIFKDGLWRLFDGDITWGNIGKTIGGAIMVGIGLGMAAYGAIKLLTSAFPESALATWATSSGITLGGLIKVGIGVGLALGGVALMLAGFKDAFENGFDWKNMGMIAGGVILTGIGLALAASAVKSVIGKATGGGELAGNVVESLTGAKTQVEAIDTATGGVSKNLVSLAKNIAVGVGILALVAAAAVIFVGAIWAIGELLQKVGEAWGPVIENGATIAAGIALGTTLLGAVGLATFGLGTLTISSGGTVPAAIALGTAMLVLLGEATKIFVKSLASVAKQLTQQLAPELNKLNKQMPTLNTGMKNFTTFMITFAGQFVTYSTSSAVSGIAATISTVVGWFTKDPIKKMADDVRKNGKQLKGLNEQFEITNPLIKKANDHMRDYEKLLRTLKEWADRAASIGSPTNISTDFKNFSRALKDAFKDLDSTRTSNVKNIMSALNSLDLIKFKGIGTDIVKQMELGMTSYKFKLNSLPRNIKNGINVDGYWIGHDIARGVERGINNFYPSTWQFTERLKRGMRVSFEIRSPSRWARDVVGAMIGAGVETGINTYDPNFNSFKDNVFENLQDMADDAVVTPKFEMPTLDTKSLNGDISGVSRDLRAEIQGRFDYENDKTEKAIMGLTNITVEKLERLIEAVESGKVIEIDGERLGEYTDKYIKEKAVRMNTVFK